MICYMLGKNMVGKKSKEFDIIVVMYKGLRESVMMFY